MMTGIDWWEIVTLVLASVGVSLVSALVVLCRRVAEVLRYSKTAAPHLAAFTKHIIDCEARTLIEAQQREARAITLAEHQERNKEYRMETNLRLRTLEQALLLGHKISPMGEIE